MSMLLALDGGFGEMKLFFKHEGVEYKRNFESRAGKVDFNSEETLLINGERYSFTDTPLVTELGHSTKEHPLHRVLRDKALYEVYKITGATEFDLITNCSLDSFKNDRGESIKNMHEEQKEIVVEDYFGNQVKLKINNIECYAENLAGLIICKEVSLRNDTIIGIDIGTKNFQLLSLNEGKLETAYSSTLGMNMIYMEAFDLVKTINPRVKSPQHIKEYLRRTHKTTFTPMADIDDAIYKALNKEIFPQIVNRLNNMDSLFTKYVFIGGGSDYLRRFLEKKFVEEKKLDVFFTKDSFFANAIGLYAKGERIFQYKNGVKSAEAVTKIKKTQRNPKKSSK